MTEILRFLWGKRTHVDRDVWSVVWFLLPLDFDGRQVILQTVAGVLLLRYERQQREDGLCI